MPRPCSLDLRMRVLREVEWRLAMGWSMDRQGIRTSFKQTLETRRGRLARARAAVKRHPDYSESGYLQAVDAAFNNWGSYAKGWPVTATFDAVAARAAFSPAQLGLNKRL